MVFVTQWLLFLAIAIGLPLSSTSKHASSSQNKFNPNIIIIYSDDLGYSDLHFTGNPTISTPNLDQMSVEGIALTQFYSAAPICTPSRAAMLTGRYPVRVGMYANTSFAMDSWQRKDGIGGIPSREITIAEALEKYGYDTKLVGKWHLGQKKEYLPLQHGFQSYYGTPSTHDHIASLHFPCTVVMKDNDIIGRLVNGGMDPTYEHECNISEAAGKPFPVDDLIQVYTSKIVSYIEEHRLNKDSNTGDKPPFLLVYTPDNTHLPVYASSKFRGTSRRGLYGDAVQELDWSVGQILQTIRNGHNENARDTIVFFTSDNGAQGGHGNLGSMGSFKCMKGTTWEGGVREPALIWGFPYGSVLPTNEVRMQLSTTMDIFPTILELLSTEYEESSSLQIDTINKMDGKSLLNILLDNHKPSPHESFIYWRGDVIYAIRLNAYKIHFYTEGCTSYWVPGRTNVTSKPIVYNIEEDIEEKYPINATLVPELYKQIVNKAMMIRDNMYENLKHDKSKNPPQLNYCDPAAALYYPDYPVPSSNISECVYS